MKKENLKPSFTNWLNDLQQESWQLEMIISGLSLALLMGSYDDISKFAFLSEEWSAASDGGNALSLIVQILHLAWFFLLINLCFHLLLRGLWISTLGLRYVSGDIDYEKLRYSNRFEKYLKNNIGSFDNYINQLENLCSIIFSFTFLIIFSLLSLILFLSGITLAFSILGNFFFFDIELYIGLFIIACGLLYLIDFISLGFFKRRKKYFAWYFWIYRLVSIITLAHLYRPIYYNFIDNKLGKYFAYGLVPYIFLSMYLSTLTVFTHKYYPNDATISYVMEKSDYADLAPDIYPPKPQINSKYIKNGFVEVFLPYDQDADNDVIEIICPDFIPSKEVGVMVRDSGIELNISLNGMSTVEAKKEKNDYQTKSSLTCLQQTWRISLEDSVLSNLNYFLFSKDNSFGLKTIIDVENMKRGQHHLILEKKRLIDRITSQETDSLYFEVVEYIPFWTE